MWKIYLDMEDYAAALANCRTALQGDPIYLAQAEATFFGKNFYRAASFYAKINYILSFEEITLKFMCVNEQDACGHFLLQKLDNLSHDDKCQITMISTWATELYLDEINWLLLEDDFTSSDRRLEYQPIIKELHAFLSELLIVSKARCAAKHSKGETASLIARKSSGEEATSNT
ncbi:hypothetical protein Nepgr_012307 [Nepenthes gracilis]|uniref:Uncharacterized protein n=1 Tax=Nepenthes gracilis TaxID=150966 RepID=A0AAD3SHA8_NEPGR|nr:hypothetical protein Nepgr_012307 [Nepenthes gracilis]